tara:strand:+ start:1456 stop:1674 length:219 start_codon:yes stop_codon:yes gene_type:complete
MAAAAMADVALKATHIVVAPLEAVANAEAAGMGGGGGDGAGDGADGRKNTHEPRMCIQLQYRRSVKRDGGGT